MPNETLKDTAKNIQTDVESLETWFEAQEDWDHAHILSVTGCFVSRLFITTMIKYGEQKSEVAINEFMGTLQGIANAIIRGCVPKPN